MTRMLCIFFFLGCLSCSSEKCDSVSVDAFTPYVSEGENELGKNVFQLPIYSSPNGKQIFKLPSDDGDSWPLVIEEVSAGFFKIRNTWSQEYVQKVGGNWGTIWKNDWMADYQYIWIKGGTACTNTHNYDGETVSLFSEPSTYSKIDSELTTAQTVTIWDACERWAFVEAMNENRESIRGWLAPDDQCGNPYTTCN